LSEILIGKQQCLRSQGKVLFVSTARSDIPFDQKTFGSFDDCDAGETMLVEIVTGRSQRVFVSGSVSSGVIQHGDRPDSLYRSWWNSTKLGW